MYLCMMKSNAQEVENADYNPEAIGPKFIDLEKILAAKKVKVPGLVRRWMERLLHVKEINAGIYENRHLHGIPFAQKFIEGTEPHNLGITIKTRGMDNIPAEGNQMIVGNHPLGGPDGIALMTAVGRVRTDINFPVNDLQLNKGDSLHICVMHNMKREIMPGIADIGISLTRK